MKRRDFLSGLAVTSATLAAGQAAKSTDASQIIKMRSRT